MVEMRPNKKEMCPNKKEMCPNKRREGIYPFIRSQLFTRWHGLFAILTPAGTCRLGRYQGP
eukprot:5950186-Amphidinium_carterae.1